MEMLEYIKNYSSDYFSKVLQNARNIHPDYKTALQERMLLSERTRGNIADNEMKAQLQAYIDSMNYIGGMEYGYLYFQGYTDCIKLLQFLKII
jgi:hypothetical protein